MSSMDRMAASGMMAEWRTLNDSRAFRHEAGSRRLASVSMFVPISPSTGGACRL